MGDGEEGGGGGGPGRWSGCTALAPATSCATGQVCDGRVPLVVWLQGCGRRTGRVCVRMWPAEESSRDCLDCCWSRHPAKFGTREATPRPKRVLCFCAWPLRQPSRNHGLENCACAHSCLDWEKASGSIAACLAKALQVCHRDEYKLCFLTALTLLKLLPYSFRRVQFIVIHSKAITHI